VRALRRISIVPHHPATRTTTHPAMQALARSDRAASRVLRGAGSPPGDLVEQLREVVELGPQHARGRGEIVDQLTDPPPVEDVGVHVADNATEAAVSIEPPGELL